MTPTGRHGDGGAAGAAAPSVAELVERFGALREQIARAGGSDVTVVAVTKGFGADVIAAAVAAGATDIGESYAQEMRSKIDELDERSVEVPTWHFIGRLQRNKVRSLVPRVGLWQSIDRIELAREVARRQPGAHILVQVNISSEPQKGGCPPAAVEEVVAGASGLGLDVQGLMGVGPADEPDRARSAFRTLVRLADGLDLPVRSIGMTDDVELAVAEGSTMVRVGRSLFGDRPPAGAGP